MKHNSMKQGKFFSLMITSIMVWGAIACQPVLADQCAYISKQQALNAISRLDIDQIIYQLCQPCGEQVPQVTKVSHLVMEKVDYEDYWQIKVNDRGIDLAYIFVDSGIEGNLLNLAAIADCPASRVSTVIALPESE